jgi:ethanolamine utilization protein EutA
MLDGDIAQTLGGIIRDEMKLDNDLAILDGLSLRDFDYIDLGKIRLPSFTVPVTVKSLLFQDDPRGPRRQERISFTAKAESHSHTHSHGHDHHHHHHHHHGHAHSHPHAHDPSETQE